MTTTYTYDGEGVLREVHGSTTLKYVHGTAVDEPLGVDVIQTETSAPGTEGTDVWGYEWNARNELTRVLKNGEEQARFAYDPVSRRVEKVGKVAGGGTKTTDYLYDGESIVWELHCGSWYVPSGLGG